MNKANFRTAYVSISQIRRFSIATMEIADNNELIYLMFQIAQLADHARHMMQDIDVASRKPL